MLAAAASRASMRTAGGWCAGDSPGGAGGAKSGLRGRLGSGLLPRSVRCGQGARWPLVCWPLALRPAWRLGRCRLRGGLLGLNGGLRLGAGFEPAGNTASDRAARHRARVQSRGMKTGSAVKAGRPMFSGEMKKTFEKAAGREEAAFGMA